MKKFIQNNLLFSITLLLTFGFLNLLYKNYIIHKDYHFAKYNELFHPKVKADIAILGTSRARRGINPRNLETDTLSAFNFALEGSSPPFMYYWYNNFFSRNYPKPELMVVEVNCLEFQHPQMRNIEEDTRYFPFKDYLKVLYHSNNKTKALFNRYYLFNHKIFETEVIDESYNGFTPYIGKPEKIVPLNMGDLKIRNEMFDDFQLLLNAFKRDNVKVVLIMLPTNTDDDFQNGKIFNRLSTIANNAEIKLIDYRNYFQSDSLFYDLGHVNIKGAEIISTKISQDIKIFFQ